MLTSTSYELLSGGAKWSVSQIHKALVCIHLLPEPFSAVASLMMEVVPDGAVAAHGIRELPPKRFRSNLTVRSVQPYITEGVLSDIPYVRDVVSIPDIHSRPTAQGDVSIWIDGHLVV